MRKRKKDTDDIERESETRYEERTSKSTSIVGIVDFCVRGYVLSSVCERVNVRVYVCLCLLSCHVHSAETLCVQSSWRASQKARYLLLVTLLDVIIVCPRRMCASRKAGRKEKFKGSFHE